MGDLQKREGECSSKSVLDCQVVYPHQVVEVIYADDVIAPCYAHEGDSGMDVRAHISSPIIMQPMERVLVPTGIRVALPSGVEMQVRPRSGQSLKRGLMVILGTVDSCYRGEVGVILINLDTQPQTIEPQERIGQLVFSRFEKMVLKEVKTFSTCTERGESGFGSSGVK